MYNKSVQLYFTDFDKNKKLRNDRLLQILSDVSISHTKEEYNLPATYMEDRGKFWVLYSWKISMKEKVKTDDVLNFKTFVTIEKEIYSYRYFIIENRDNKVIGFAFAHWISLDLTTRRLSSIPSDIKSLLEARDLDKDLKNRMDEVLLSNPLKRIRNINFDYEKKIEVSYFDMDMNNHINNSVYDKLAQSAILDEDKDFLRNHYVKSFSIIYKKEKTTEGYVVSKVKFNNDNNTTYHEIFDEENTLLAIAEYEWY